MSVRVTLVLGTSNLFADAGEKCGLSWMAVPLTILSSAVSMAFGDYLSTRAELSHHQSLWQQSQAEHDKGADRVARGLHRRGLSEEDARRVVAVLAQSPDALAHAVLGELDVPAECVTSVRNLALLNGAVTLVSFLGFGSVPLLAYAVSGSSGGHFGRAVVLTGITLFALGAVESLVTHQSMLVSGIETLLTGLLASAIAYGIGRYAGEGPPSDKRKDD